MKKLTYREVTPPSDLLSFAECFWLTGTFESVRHSVPPDGCLDIVYSPEAGLRAVGAMTVAQTFMLRAGTRTIGLRFRPGMAGAMLDIAPSELTGRVVPLEELWGRRAIQLTDQLSCDESAEESLANISRALRRPDVKANAVQRAIEHMTLLQGRVDLDYLARQANLSPRQFRRRCLEESGLSPKRLSRILRLRSAQSIAQRAPHPDWAEIAVEAGYFDQAHLIRDFRELLGRTPMSVLSNRAEPALP